MEAKITKLSVVSVPGAIRRNCINKTDHNKRGESDACRYMLVITEVNPEG